MSLLYEFFSLPSSESDSTYCSDCSDLAVKARRKSYSKPNDASSLPPMSAKIAKLLEILEDIDERSNGEEKTIVFSQFTSMLDIVQKFLKNDGVTFVRCEWICFGGYLMSVNQLTWILCR